MRLWDPRTGRILNRLTGLRGFGNSVDFNVDGTKIAVASLGEIRLWNPKTGELLHILTGDLRNTRAVAFSPDGSTVASGGGYQDHAIRLWDTNTGKLLHTLAWHTRDVMRVAFSSDSVMLAGASKDGTVSLWHTKTGLHLWSLTGHTHELVGVAFSRDGRKMASASTRNAILWDAETWEPIHTLEGHYNEACVPVFSPDSRTLAWGSANAAVRLWDVDTGESLRSMRGHAGGVTGVAFSPDGASLASASWDGTVLVWDLAPSTSEDFSMGDVNGDGEVNILDLVQVAANLGKIGENDADVNGDDVVNILDLVQVAGAIGGGGAAPSANSLDLSIISAADVAGWLAQAQGLGVGDANLERGIHFLEQLLAALMPDETVLFPNYPNPFNPETWIPYHLAHRAEVEITIYDVNGALVRRLTLGHQAAGYYADRGRAAYWDGRNERGESVGSGVYVYQLRAGDYAEARRMVIVK